MVSAEAQFPVTGCAGSGGIERPIRTALRFDSPPVLDGVHVRLIDH